MQAPDVRVCNARWAGATVLAMVEKEGESVSVCVFAAWGPHTLHMQTHLLEHRRAAVAVATAVPRWCAATAGDSCWAVTAGNSCAGEWGGVAWASLLRGVPTARPVVMLLQSTPGDRPRLGHLFLAPPAGGGRSRWSNVSPSRPWAVFCLRMSGGKGWGDGPGLIYGGQV